MLLISSLFFVMVENVESNDCRTDNTIYCDSYSNNAGWRDPQYIVDSSTVTAGYTNANGSRVKTYAGSTGLDATTPVHKVEIRVRGFYSNLDANNKICLRPYLVSTGYFDYYNYTLKTSASWSDWFDITDDDSAPLLWYADVVSNLQIFVESSKDPFLASLIFCNQIQIRFNYSWSTHDAYCVFENCNYVPCHPVDRRLNMTFYDFDDHDIRYNVSLYNYTDGNNTLHSYNTGTVPNGTQVHFSTMFLDMRNSTFYRLNVSSYDDCTYTYNETFFSTPCHCSCPDADESKTNNSYTNFSLVNDSWINISWFSWFNDSATDTLETFLTLENYYLNTSNVSGSCYPYYFNYSDDNITINITINPGVNSSNYSISDENYLLINGLSLDTQVLSLSVIALFFLFAERKNDYILYIFTAIISVVSSVYYLSLDTFSLLSLNTWIGIILMCFGVYTLFLAIVYAFLYGARKT